MQHKIARKNHPVGVMPSLCVREYLQIKLAGWV